MVTNAARHRGFTLLELMLAAAMVAMLGLTLYASMSIGFRARSGAKAQLEAMREAALVMDLVQRDFQSIPPPVGVLAGPFVGYAMGGSGAEADSVEFHALGRDAAIDGETDAFGEGMRRIELVLRTDGDTPRLVRRVERNLLRSIEIEPEEEWLSRRVRAFSVRYYDGLEWSAEWDSTLMGNALPLAVEVSMTFDLPSPLDRARPYRLTRVIPLSCGRSIEDMQ